MQTKRKMMFYRWITFLMVAICGALLTWAIVNSLAAGHFDYSAFIAKVNSNDIIRFFMEKRNVFSLLATMLWVALTMMFAETISRSSLDLVTYMQLNYLFGTAPVYALLLIYFYVTGTEIPFQWKLLLWVEITNVLWLAGRRYYGGISLILEQSMNAQTERHWTKLDRMDAKVIANVLGKEGVLRRMLDGTLYFGDSILNASLVPSLQPGQSVDLREICGD